MNDDDTPIWSEITGELGCPSLSNLPAVTPLDPFTDPLDACGPPTCDDIPEYALAIADRLLMDLAARAALYDTAVEIITGRLDQIMTDLATAQADVRVFVDDVKAHFATMSAQVADLKAKLAAAPSPDPAVQTAVDGIESALAEGHAVIDAAPVAPPAPAGPAGGTVTTSPDGSTTPSPAAPAPEQTVTPPAVADAGSAVPATPAPAVPTPAAPGSVVTSDGTPPAAGGSAAPGSVVDAPAPAAPPSDTPAAPAAPADAPPAPPAA